jgi:hypothetical protein
LCRSLNDFARPWQVFDDLPESRAKATLKAPELKNDVAPPYLSQAATLSAPASTSVCVSPQDRNRPRSVRLNDRDSADKCLAALAFFLEFLRYSADLALEVVLVEGSTQR